MITTIKQRIYVFGLLPLGTLAVSLVISNGFFRIDDANRELERTEQTAAALLQSPAIDSLVIGNSLEFEQAVSAVMRTSPALRCVQLNDIARKPISRIGRCGSIDGQLKYFPVREPGKALSDYGGRLDDGRLVGEVGLLMEDPGIVRKRQTILSELGVSLIAIGLVLVMTGRLLRTRLIMQIGRIGSAMHAVSRRDYSTRVPIEGNDELTRLAEAVNNTIATVAEYTRELERRRGEADQALQDADAANLARDGLVRSLTEDLAEPMSSMHGQLTTMALANTDPALRERIKNVIGLLQDAQSDFADLVEIATQIEGTRGVPWVEATRMWAEIERDIKRLSETEAIPVNFVLTRAPERGDLGKDLLLNVDGVRLKKALLYLIRALARCCAQAGVHVTADLIRFAPERLHLSVHLIAFGATDTGATGSTRLGGFGRPQNELRSAIGLTDRESKIIDYLLRAIGSTPTVDVAPTGTINVLLNLACPYAIEGAITPTLNTTDWMFAASPISATFVSNDVSLLRYTTRGDMSNHELKLLSFSQAIAFPAALQGQDALLIDISDDMAEVMRLFESMAVALNGLPHLIAICPPGVVPESLSNRLFDLGFEGVVQKPLQYRRLIEVIRETLSHPLGRLRDTQKPSAPDGAR